MKIILESESSKNNGNVYYTRMRNNVKKIHEDMHYNSGKKIFQWKIISKKRLKQGNKSSKVEELKK